MFYNVLSVNILSVFQKMVYISGTLVCA